MIARNHEDRVPWVLGGAIVIAIVVLIAFTVPILPCPSPSFDRTTGRHDYGGTPALTCLYCQDSGEITLLQGWRCHRERRALEPDPREGTAPRSR